MTKEEFIRMYPGEGWWPALSPCQRESYRRQWFTRLARAKLNGRKHLVQFYSERLEDYPELED